MSVENLAPARPPKKFHPDPFTYHQEIELSIDSLTNLGVGVGRIEGWVVFVPFALPEDTVRARVYRNDKRHSEADLVEVLQPSPHRVEPSCELFGYCGGCQYQHLSYEQQLHWKRKQVADLLKHMVKLEIEVAPVIHTEQTFGYRSKITPHFQKPRDGVIETIGFLQVGRRRAALELDHCPIAMDSLNERLTSLKADTRANAKRYKKGATILLRASDGPEKVITDTKNICNQRVGELNFRFPAGDFFQNNPFILEAFTGYVRDEATAEESKFLVDAYCGSGLFCLTAAHAFEQAMGVEVSGASIEWARNNAEANKITNATFIAGKSEALFPECPFPGNETAMIVDPPRKGCDELFLNQLFAFGPKRVIYVSCNPATQMRDLNAFAQHGYQLTAMQPFDLFPQTRHLECVATLVRTSE